MAHDHYISGWLIEGLLSKDLFDDKSVTNIYTYVAECVVKLSVTS